MAQGKSREDTGGRGQRNSGLQKALLGPPWEREDSLLITGWAPRGTRLEGRAQDKQLLHL